MKFYIYIVVLLLMLQFSYSNNNLLKLNADEVFNFKKGSEKLLHSKNSSILLATSKIKPLNIDKNTINNIINQSSNKLEITDFAIDDYNKFNLILTKEDDHTLRNTKVVVHKKGGETIYKLKNYAFYTGKLDGQENSHVYMTLLNDNCYIYLQKDDGETFSISPIKENIEGLHLLEPHTLAYNNEDSYTYTCETEDYTGTKTEYEDLYKHKDQPELQSPVAPLLEARIICEGSYDYYEQLGKNEDKIASHIAAVMLMSSKIYQENLNITFVVPEIHIRTDYYEDPYVVTENLSEKLNYMPNVWIDYKTPRALVVLFANLNNQPSNTVIAGISMGGAPYVGSICSTSRGYCVLGITNSIQYPTINYTWDVNVAVHEMGHNFSAPHTHNCYWAPNMIDTCVTKTKPIEVGDACLSGNPIPRPGTIMSYCHTTNSTRSVQLFFHKRQHPLMRGAAESSKCVTAKSERFVSLLAPLGGEEYKSESELNVRWTYSKTTRINIYLSTDNGVTWTKENNSPVTAQDSIYKMKLPEISTTTALVRIEDIDDPTINDVSIQNFTINIQKIKFLFPRENESYMKGESIKAQWSQTMKEDFVLEFSKDNGSSWESIQTTANNLYISTPVDFESDACQFRITSQNDGAQYYSSKFSIGKPEFKLLTPIGGEKAAVGFWYFITWNSKNINKVQLEYSIDNGNNWKRIVLSAQDAVDGQYAWTVPDQITDSAKVRIKTSVAPYDILDESKNVFSIYKAPISVEEQTSKISNDLEVLSIAPNPADDRQLVSIKNNTEQSINFNISIIDIEGKNCYSIDNLSISPQSNITRDINTKKLSTGNYYLVIKYNGTTISKQIVISR